MSKKKDRSEILVERFYAAGYESVDNASPYGTATITIKGDANTIRAIEAAIFRADMPGMHIHYLTED